VERIGLERVGAEWHVKRGALAIRDGHEIGLPEKRGKMVRRSPSVERGNVA
jgi:hypothetical protein